MPKIKTPVTDEEKNIEVSRSEKVLQSAKESVKTIAKNGKKIYSIHVKGTKIETTDIDKWNNYLDVNQVKMR